MATALALQSASSWAWASDPDIRPYVGGAIAYISGDRSVVITLLPQADGYVQVYDVVTNAEPASSHMERSRWKMESGHWCVQSGTNWHCMKLPAIVQGATAPTEGYSVDAAGNVVERWSGLLVHLARR